ncbi:MFS transporter [Actinoplanes sp. N902-109]|uniref:MFS transporter n=1 Tax=Actinoplanes sp. (strain N902-109) TaxID=649831 RepID=UPI00032953B5|nr:MFS transporter [Actinoplanes sp. N902-109]AGL13733.1 major facilitator superfamily MFS_1 [Actinoplanes sp. N902-109]
MTATTVIGRRNAVTWLFATVAGLSVANMYYIIVLLPDIAADRHEPVGSFAGLLSVTQLGYAVGLLLIVPLGDVIDRRALCIALLACATAVLAAVPIVRGPLAPVMFFLLGLSSVTAMVIVPWGADLADPTERGRVVGRIMTGLILGTLLCRTYAGFLADLVSWQVVYWVAAVASASCALILRMVRPPVVAGGPAHSYTGLLASLPVLLIRVPQLWQRCLYGVLGFGGFSLFWSVLPLHLAQPPFRFGSVGLGLFGVLGTAGVAGASIAGRLADRGRQTVVTVAAFALAAVSFIALAAAPQALLVLVAATVTLDLGVQAAHITNQTVIYAAGTAARSRITTIYMVTYFAGGALGSAAGAILWRTEGWGAAMVVGAALTAAAGVIAVMLRVFRARNGSQREVTARTGPPGQS